MARAIDEAMSILHGTKPKNPHRISIRELEEREGVDRYQLAEDATMDSICPALCEEGCEVEPDGRCEHGCPSLLLAMGII